MLIDWLQSDLQTINMVCNDLYDNLLTRLGIIFGYFLISPFLTKTIRQTILVNHQRRKKHGLNTRKLKRVLFLDCFMDKLKAQSSAKFAVKKVPHLIHSQTLVWNFQ